MAQPSPNTESSTQLRVAFVWNGALQAEELLPLGTPVTMGSASSCLFPLPENVGTAESVSVLEPSGDNYRLRIAPEMRGDVWLGGNRKSVRNLASQGEVVDLGPADYGVVSMGSVSMFFQRVRAAEKLPRRFFALDSDTALSVGLAAFLAVAMLLFLFLVVRKDVPDPDPLELSPDLIAKFMVTPPPDSIVEQMRKESGTETKDPGLRDRDETGGKRAEKEEGRVGKQDAKQENTEIAGARTEAVAKVRNMGLLGALSGGGQKNAIADALDVPNVNDVLGGLGSAQTIMGRGTGGAGLRGSGPGGGGNGPGSLFGAGNLGTGVGAGSGNGLGKGAGGIGAKGRERKERAISMTAGTPKVNGYLSPEQINRVVRANQAAIRYCYELQVQRQPSLKGRVEVQWRINLQGSVTTARVATSTLRNAGVEGCMVRQIRMWHFPKPDGGEVVVTYPFIFGVQG